MIEINKKATKNFVLALPAFLYSGNLIFPDCYFCNLNRVEQN